MRIVIDTTEVWNSIKFIFSKIGDAHNRLMIRANTSVVIAITGSIFQFLAVVVILSTAWFGDPDRFPFEWGTQTMKIFSSIVAVVGLYSLWSYSRTWYYYFFKKEKYEAYVKETTLMFSKPLPEGTKVTVEYTANSKSPAIRKLNDGNIKAGRYR